MTRVAISPLSRVLAAAAVLMPGVAAAQDEDAADVIVVTGEGLDAPPAAPAYASVTIDRDRLLAAASGRIEDSLAQVAGFQQFRRSDSRSANPSAQGATLRALGGNATSRALVLLDGVPMTDPFFGYVPFSALAPERLARVRVTRGGGSGPFGAGALAGTIELESSDAATLGPVSGRLLVNDRGESEAAAALAGEIGGGFGILSARWDRGQGFWTTPADQRVPASARAAYDAWSLEARGAIPLAGNAELQVRGLAFDDRRTLRFDGADSRIAGQDASLRLVGRGAWAYEFLGYLQARDFSNVVISARSFTPTLDQRATPSTGIGGKFELRPPLPAGHLLRLGLDYRLADGEIVEDAISPASGLVTARRRAGGTTGDLGGFAELDTVLGPLVLTLGARADRYAIRDGFFTERDAAGLLVREERYGDRKGWIGSLRGGVLARLGAGASLRAAAYSGLRLPTLNELYRPFTVFPVVTEANAALEPERLTGFEAGIDYAPSPAFTLSLTGFDNRVKDAVANVTLGPNLRQRRNIAAIRARGIESSANLRVGHVSLAGSLAITDAIARQDGADFDGRRPAQTPRFSAAASLGWRPVARTELSLSLRHVGAQYEDDLESDLLPAFTTLDAFAQLPISARLVLVLRAENLTATRIVTRNQAGSIDTGTPRTVWAGVRFGL
mgnify:CR=1 FL=1